MTAYILDTVSPWYRQGPSTNKVPVSEYYLFDGFSDKCNIGVRKIVKLVGV